MNKTHYCRSCGSGALRTVDRDAELQFCSACTLLQRSLPEQTSWPRPHESLAFTADLNGSVSALVALFPDDEAVTIKLPYAIDGQSGGFRRPSNAKHVYCFTLTACRVLFMRHDIYIVDAEIETDSGQLAVTLSRSHISSTRVKALLDLEYGFGACSYGFYTREVAPAETTTIHH